MRIVRILLPLFALLMWSATTYAQDDGGGQYTLTTRCIPAEGGSAYPESGTYEANASVNVYCYENTGFRFLQWEDESGNVVSTSRDFYYTMPTRDITLTARFEFDPDTPHEPTVPEITEWATIKMDTYPEGAGSFYVYGSYSKVNDSEWKFEVGTTVGIYAEPNYRYKFVNWTENGEVISTSIQLQFPAEKEGRHIVANYEFAPDTPSEPGTPVLNHKLTLNANPATAVSSLYGAGEYSSGSEVNVWGYANEHYIFENWTDDRGNVVSDALDFTYTIPDRHVTLTANFRYQYDPSTPEEPGSPDNDDHGVTARPRIDMYDDTHVMMLSTTAGATIHYTLDGTEPTTSSSIYSQPVFVPSNLTVKAMAVKAGLENSPVTTYQVTAYHAAAPVFTFKDYKVEISSATPGAIIRYNIGRNDPTEDSPIYQEPLELNDGDVVKAIAYAENLTPSEVSTFVFQKSKYILEAPVITKDTDGKLVITAAKEGCVIRYTTDGTEPTISSALYSSPLTLDGNFIVKAYAKHPNFMDSPVAEYILEGFKVARPELTFADRVLSMSTPTAEASIRYTTDGSIPTESSVLYSQPLNLMEDCTVTAMGFKDNYEPSEVAAYTFIYGDHQAARPEISYDSETHTVTMTTATEDASIRYTTNGDTPTATTGVAYAGPFVVEGNKLFVVRAFRNDLFDSESAELRIDDQQVPTPTASFANRRLTLTCSDPEATIYYTLDGSTPSESSIRYNGAIELTEDCTVLFVGVREGFNTSDVDAYEFHYAEHQVMQPEVSYDPESRTVSMTCATDNASIRYTTNRNVPTATTGVSYTGPFTAEGNATYTVRAFRNDLFDSETTVFEVNDQTVPTPTASFANRRLTLTCSDTEATIYYTLDGSEPSASSTRYTGAVELTENCLVSFIGVREGFNNSDVAYYEFNYADHQVMQPEVSYDPESRTVTMTCATENASIRYTTNGNVPTATTGTSYSGPFTAEGNATYTVRAFRNDLFDSEVTVFEVNDQTVPTPTASFANRRLRLTCSDTEATIYYTTDGSEPSATSTRYTSPVELTEDCTVRFIGVREGFNNSKVNEFQFSYAEYQVEQPEVSYNPESRTVTMTCTTENASIRYTTNGNVPTATTGVSYSAPFVVDGNQTFIVRAFRNDLFDSETATLEVNDQTVPTPTASFANKRLTLTCSDPEATIYYTLDYTLDGSEPSANSTRYTGPVELTEDCPVYFIAIREGFNNSEVAYYEFHYAEHQVMQPEVSYNPESRTVTMTCATENASIRYTTNGDTPTATTGISYSGPFTAEGNATYTVRAFRNDLFDSETTVFEVNDQTVPTPTASFANRRLTLTCSDPEATIYYTTDGSEPTSGSTRYTGAVELTEDCTVSFIGVREGFNDSETGYFEFRKASYQVATPVMDYDTDSKTLTMTCATEGASIRYTTDGTVPTATTGTVYSGSITVDGNQTYTAMAFAEGLFDSEPARLSIDSQKVPTPTASFANKMLTLTCPDARAEIHYTTDGSEPTATSTLYTAPIALTSDCTVKFIAVREGYNDSGVASFEFVRSIYTVASPTFRYDATKRQMTISCATDGAQIRYTTDGSEPTATTGNVYTQPVTVEGNLTFKAIATRSDLFDSAVTSHSVSDQTVPTPTANFANRLLTLTCADAEAEIHYTIDGNTPTATSTLYSSPVSLTNDCTVLFIAIRDGFNDSEVAYYEFIYAEHQVMQPEVSYNPESRTVTMTCATENASIRYTTNGNVPTATTGISYSGPFVVEGNKTLTVRAFRNDLFDSEVTTLEVNDQTVPTPTASFANRRLTLTCPDTEATIYYTTDGSEPTASSTRYTGPVELTENCPVYFIAVREGFNNSEVAYYDFIYADHQVAVPDISYDAETSTVTMDCATNGASIRYTTNGDVPTATTGVSYSAPFVVEGNKTFTVRAFRNDLFDSEMTTLEVNDQTVPMPTASFANRRLTLTCSDPEATIYYTLDGDSPSVNSTRYTAAIELTEDCVVTFIAIREGFNDSETGYFEFRKYEYQAATPVMNYDTDSKTLTMTCATEGASIRYTTDGTVPTATTGTAYSGPITVDGNHIYTAVAFAEGLFDSEVASISIDSQKVPTPTATFANKTLTISCPDAKAEIRYTTDGRAPTSTWTVYTGPVSLTIDCTVLFMAVREGYNDSDVASFEFVRGSYTAATPTFSYDAARRLMTIASATEGAQIRYTTDGSEPTATTGTAYTQPVAVEGNLTFKAVATRGDLFDSAVSSYSVSDQTVPTPTASFANKVLTLTCSDTEAAIHYTTDGSDPTASSTLYAEPVSLTSDCTVRFIAVRNGYNDSEVASFEFRKASYQAATPVMNYETDSKTLTMTCATEGASIRYAMDGSVPTATTGTPYSGPITVDGNHIYTAVAFAEGLFDSEVASISIDSQKVPTPTADFANKVLTLTCPDTKAEIHYTIDGSNPTATSTLYTAPVALTSDCTVLFMAVREGYNDSEVASFEFVRGSYTAATPTFSYDAARRLMAIASATEGAEIRYTTDGSEPTATTGTAYTQPVAVEGNLTFKAVATRGDLFDSAVSSYSVSDQTVPTPTASFANKMLTLTCPDSEAAIHYTADGSAPTATSTLYTAPVALTSDCTVRFIAVRSGFNDSEVASFEFRKVNYQTATPVMDYDTDSKTLTMTCTTEGAVIRYTRDGTAPTATTGTAYSGPITVDGNQTYTAVAFAEGLFDSEVVVISIDSQKVPTPTATFANKVLTLSCPDAKAEIHYTIDGSTPTASSTLYTSPVSLTGDCTVLFIAVREGYNDSEIATYEFRIADHTEAIPTLTPDYRGRSVGITQPRNLPVLVSIDGNTETVATPATIEVTTGMKSIRATAIASDGNRYDSQDAELELTFHSAPVLAYDGHTLRYSAATDEPDREHAQAYVYLNGNLCQYGETESGIDISEFATASVVIESDHAFRSDESGMRLDFYNTGRRAGARNGHRLSEGFGTWDDSPADYTFLEVTGEVEKEDLEFLATLPCLYTLHLDPSSLISESFDGALTGSSIRTIFSPIYPRGLLKDMPRLTTVLWGGAGQMPEGRISEAENPNILVWVTDINAAPADAVNTVTYGYTGGTIPTDPDGKGITGRAGRITLQAGYPFNAHMPVEVDSISLTKEFTLPTVIGECAGWETITLPFTPESVTHEKAGTIVPFNAWTDQEDLKKPYWLYRATESGWEAADSIEATIPYLISMPNSTEYVEEYRLPGNVTFAATNVTLGVEESLPTLSDWMDGVEFVGTFMPVEETDIRSLNVKVLAGLDYLGSAFIEEDTTLPFGAYLRGEGLPKRIPVFGDWSGVLTPVADAAGLTVETPAPGMIRITSNRDLRTAIVTPEGATIRTLSLRAGESLTVEGLTRGLYIAAGRKVMVK